MYNGLGDKMKYARQILTTLVCLICIGLIVYFAFFFGDAKNEDATVTTLHKGKYTISFDKDTIEYTSGANLMAGVSATGENGEDLTSDVTVSCKPTKSLLKKELTYSINKNGYEIIPFTRTLTLPSDYKGPSISIDNSDIEVPIDQINSLTTIINQSNVVKADDGFGARCNIVAKFNTEVEDIGDYVITITAENVLGDTTSTKMNVSVVEAKSSIIKLSASSVTIGIGEKFDANEYVKSANHETLGDVKNSIVINSTVDTSKAGRYSVTYSFGNIEELKNEKATLIVIVK